MNNINVNKHVNDMVIEEIDEFVKLAEETYLSRDDFLKDIEL